MKKIYSTIIFLQGSEATEPLELESIKEKINYLKQWDNGDHHTIRKTKPKGSTDTEHRQEIETGMTYILHENQSYGYIGLTLEITEENNLYHNLMDKGI